MEVCVIKFIRLCKVIKLLYEITKLCKAIRLSFKVTESCYTIDNKNFNVKL